MIKLSELNTLNDKELEAFYEAITAEIKARNLTRLCIEGKAVNKDWYYLWDEQTDEDIQYYKEKGMLNADEGISRFLFVRKEFWDNNGYIEDGATHTYDIILPNTCAEYIEEGYEFQMLREDAEKLLQDLGFAPAPLDKKNW